MRLADFILHHREAILAEWEAFAATMLPAAARMAPLALRDHAPMILEAIAKDLGTPQSRDEQSAKSRGRARRIAGAPETAAQTHAVLRAQSGFDINQLVAEYRALRASVLRKWLDAAPRDQAPTDDIIRFNEAIDQAVAESVGHFHAQVERSRNLLLGMIGHDMRSPLNTIVATAAYLAEVHREAEVSDAAALLIRSGAAIQALLDDLVDFNRSALGLGIHVAPTATDLAAVVGDEIRQLRAAHPKWTIELAVGGDNRGRWDGARVQQLVRNLVSNAVQYGAPDTAIRVALDGSQADVRIEVRNRGPTLDATALDRLFDPLTRGSVPEAGPDAARGLGLGLFIVREIAAAHGGEVDARSAAGETVFAVRLPKR